MNQYFDNSNENVSNARPASEDVGRASGKKRSISSGRTNTQPQFKCPGCMCGNTRCSELRKIFKSRNDPLRRHAYHKVTLSKRKAIYENALNMSFPDDHDNNNKKDYFIATLHFPVKVLVYCQKKNKKNPTMAFKQSEWQDMIENGLGEYLPPKTDTFRREEYGGKPICFLPPTVGVQEVQYSIDVEKALSSALQGGQAFLNASEPTAAENKETHQPQQHPEGLPAASIPPREPKVRRTDDGSCSGSVASVGPVISPIPVDNNADISGRQGGGVQGQKAMMMCYICEATINSLATLPDRQESKAPIPEEISSGVQSSLSLCVAEEDGNKGTPIPTEVGSWATGFAKRANCRTDPLQGVRKLADHAMASRSHHPPGMSLQEYFERALSLGTPTTTEKKPTMPTEPINNAGTLVEQGENWKQVAVLYNDNGSSGNKLTVWENVFLVKSENPTQAYKLTSRPKRYLNEYGPKSGSIEYAIILPSIRDADHDHDHDHDNNTAARGPVQFAHPPPEQAQYVSIKKINKAKVKRYKEQEQGETQECPYREISLLREVGDNSHVHKLVEALEDDDYLYIVTPYCENRRSLRDDKNYNDYCNLGQSEQELRDLFVNVLEIVEHLHKYNLYHCALTPEYFEYHGDRVLLTRMGLAMRIPQHPTKNSPFKVPLGPLDTLSFRAPEVHSQESVANSSSSNLWSAAITLYFMATGRTPFSIPHPSDAGFRMYMSLGGLEAMTEYLDQAAIMNKIQGLNNRCPSPHALKLLSNLLRWKPSDRCSPEQALSAARQWYYPRLYS